MAHATISRRRSAAHANRPTMFAPVSAPTPPVPAPDLIAVLNQLRDTCADSAYGFASCADYSNISRHRALFRKRAQECDAAGEQLQALVLRLGGVPVRGGPPSASLHRGWVAVHGTLCGLRDSSIVSECERGETVTRERYQRALQLELPVEVRALVEHHLRDIDTSLAQIRSLREAPCAPARHAS